MQTGGGPLIQQVWPHFCKHRLDQSTSTLLCCEPNFTRTYTTLSTFSYIKQHFANIVWISLLLLYSALYLVWLDIHYIFFCFVHKTALWKHCLEQSTSPLFCSLPSFTRIFTIFSTVSYIEQPFENIVWISLFLLYSALYLVWLVLTLYFPLLSYIKQPFENIVRISLLLLCSALYLVSLVLTLARNIRKCTIIMYYNVKKKEPSASRKWLARLCRRCLGTES